MENKECESQSEGEPEVGQGNGRSFQIHLGGVNMCLGVRDAYFILVSLLHNAKGAKLAKLWVRFPLLVTNRYELIISLLSSTCAPLSFRTKQMWRCQISSDGLSAQA